MNCPEVQTNLSLYLYGELDFAQEEELEQHLDGCAFCQLALSREKGWHATLNAEHIDVPLELLSTCRTSLEGSIAKACPQQVRSWWSWLDWLNQPMSAWSKSIAFASLFLFAGFTCARWMDHSDVPAFFTPSSGLNQMGMLDPANARIRDIQSGENHSVRIIVDQVRQQEITGNPDEGDVRQWLLAGLKDPADPGIRIDSVEMLKGQSGEDIREALLTALKSDSNAAVRLKALQSLRPFVHDKTVQSTLEYVLEHDDNPGVRSEAIDALAPEDADLAPSQALLGTLQAIMQSETENDYVRMRCFQVLSRMNPAGGVY